MTNRRLGAITVGMIALLVAGIGGWRLRPPPLAASAEPAQVSLDQAQLPQAGLLASGVQAKIQAVVNVDSLWIRPPAETASRNFRRSGFAWILRQLGASDQLLDRMADGDLIAAVKDLNQQASKGDPTAIDILGEIAYQRCYLGRDDAALSAYQTSQLNQAGVLGVADGEWFGKALRADIAYDKSVMAMCKDLIDQDQITGWVAAQANRGDGASKWLMVNAANNLHEMQQRLRDAALTGFPEAQFDLAWAILGGQQGAAGTGAEAANVGDLLRASADTIPRSETQLAVCEYHGCPDVTPDLDAAVAHAREAAQRGSIDGLLEIGPHLAASQMDPDEVTAWKLINASLQLQGCGGNDFSVQWMQKTIATMASPNISASAHALAEQYWQQYRSQMMRNLGCES